MKNKLYFILISAFVVFAAGCAGTPFKWDNARKVHVGMTKEEVTKIMGKPYSVSSTSDGTEKWVWVFATGWGSSRSFRVDFKDDIVIEVPKIPDSFK